MRVFGNSSWAWPSGFATSDYAPSSSAGMVMLAVEAPPPASWMVRQFQAESSQAAAAPPSAQTLMLEEVGSGQQQVAADSSVPVLFEMSPAIGQAPQQRLENVVAQASQSLPLLQEKAALSFLPGEKMLSTDVSGLLAGKMAEHAPAPESDAPPPVAQAKGADKSGIIHPVSVGSGQLQSDPEGSVVAVQQDGYRKDRSFDSVDPGKVEPFAPTEADKQAYADMKFAMKLNFGLINFSEQKGTGYGGGANPLFTGAPNSDTWQSAPADETTWAGFDISSDNIAKSMTLPSNLFRAPYQTQAEFKHKVSDNWARRAKEAGARYIAFITRHHAGWASWDSKYTTYDIGTSSSPNIDIPQAVIDSAIDFDLKVVLWWSAIDRVHYFQQNPGGENYQQGSSNDNDEYFDFAKNQIQELLEKDPTGDTIVGFWYDLAEYKAHIGRHRLLDWKRHVQRLRPGVIQMFNQREDLGDILNIEATATFDHLARKPTSYGEPWEMNANVYDNRSPAGWWSFEDRAVDEVRPVASLDNGKLDLEPNIANEVYKAVDTNGLFLLNIPAARDGLFGPHANAALQEGGRLLNGGGRVDGFHLDWEYSFINGDKNQPEWSRYNNDGNANDSWLGTVNHATRAGAYADYKFFGKSVKVYVKTQPSNGDLNIYIDGIFRRKFRSGIAADGSVLAYSTNALSYGEHVIRIEVGEEVESGANDGKVELDFIEVAPRIWKILVDSFAGADNQYATGDNIDVRVYFNDYVKVSGTPQLEINVGGVARMANYVSGSGTRSMIFRYTVVAGDTASGGISVKANKLKLNGGTIMVDDGGAAVTTDADLNHDPMAADAQHQVAGTTISGLITGGNDRLVGLTGDNSYQLGLGTGFDEVYEGYTSQEVSGQYLRASGDASDTIRLDAGIGIGDVRLMRDHSSVWVQVLGAADGEGNRQLVSSIKLVNYYENDQSKIEQIVFADGVKWGRDRLHQIAISGGSGDDSLYGRDDMADIFDGSSGGNDRLVGLGGNDEYRLGFKTGFDQIYEGYTRDYGASSSYLSWGRHSASWSMEQASYHPSSEYLRPSGDAGDVIRLDAGIEAGDVKLVRTGDSLVVQLLGSADAQGTREVVASLQVVDHYANEQSRVEQVLFADGRKFLLGSAGEDVLQGSAASETYYGFGGSNTYRFGRDFGSDSVVGDGRAVFSGYGSSQLRFAADGNDLLVSALGTASQARFVDWLSSGASRTIETSNGRSLEVERIIQALSVIQSDGMSNTQSITVEDQHWATIVATS